MLSIERRPRESAPPAALRADLGSQSSHLISTSGKSSSS
jgi:hypothetical protein